MKISQFVKNLILVLILAVTALNRAIADENHIDPIKNVIEPIFEAVKNENMDSVRSLLTEDATLHAMFNPNAKTGLGSVRSFSVEAYFELITANYDNIKFVDREYSVADNGQTVWMLAKGDLTLQSNGQPYKNRYVFQFSLNDKGKIVSIREWVNTVTLLKQGIAARGEN